MKNAYIYIIALAAIAGVIIGGILGFSLGDRDSNTNTVVVSEYCELTGWQLLTMAIIKTESEFDSQAIGKTNDLGILQITAPYVREANRLIDTLCFQHTDAFDVAKSLEMFNIVQNTRNPEHDIEKAISLHNPNGDSIGYTEKVLANFRYLSRLEEIRKEVTNW